MTNDPWQLYSTTLRKLLARPDLREEFQQDVDGSATHLLGISEEMRNDLKKLLLYFPPSEPGGGQRAASTDRSTSRHPDGEDGSAEQSALSAERFFMQTYRQLRIGAAVTTIMSVLIFIVGLVLLGLAAAQSIDGEEASTAIVVAASGIASIAAAFYRSPVSQIRESAAEVQRSSMVLLSYMLGLGLLSKSLAGRRTLEEATMLTSLTTKLVALLGGERVAEPSGSMDGAE